MKRILSLLLLLFCITAADAKDDNPISYDTLLMHMDTLLEKYVTDKGRVRYGKLKQNQSKLLLIVEWIEEIDINKDWTEEEEKSFYINAYNILVIKQVIDKYPIRRTVDVKGFFDKKKFRVAGRKMTLNDIEAKRLMKEFEDPRIHFAINYGAMGCPDLINRPYYPKTLNRQLNNVTRQYLRDLGHTRVETNTKRVLVSEIFAWYREDFLEKEDRLIDYVNKYQRKTARFSEEYSLTFYKFNWTLNDSANGR